MYVYCVVRSGMSFIEELVEIYDNEISAEEHAELCNQDITKNAPFSSEFYEVQKKLVRKVKR